MADRYWVGGTGSWSSTNTANWSASSGGASGASVPTAADNVIFDAGSDAGGIFTVTMANSPRLCNDFTASGLDFTMTLAGTAIGLTVSGSLTFPATNFTRTYTGITTFNAITTGKTITTNGRTFGQAVVMDGVGGAWTLGSALDIGTNTLQLTNGTFDTSASNYAVTAGAFFSSNSNIRTINLNASTITLSGSSGWFMQTSTNATLNAGTSTISLSNSVPTFAGGNLTYYNVSFTSTAATSSIKVIDGANTFNNLTFSTIASAGLNIINIGANQTINGTLTINGANGNQRQFISSSVTGTTRTLTCAAIAGMTDVDFKDTTIAGAHGTLSGTRLGDCGGNSNITFVAGVNKYWNLAAGGNWSAVAWALSSGGAISAANFPLAQDTVIIGNTGLNTSATITINSNWNIGTLDTSTRTNAMTLASSTFSPTFYGNFTYGSGVTPTGTGTYTFSNRATKTLNSGGKTFTQPVTIDAPGGGIQLLTNNLTLGSTLTTSLTRGTLDLNNLTLTTGFFNSSNLNTRTIAFGTTGQITLTGNATTVWTTGTTTNLTTTGTFLVVSNYAGSTGTRTFTLGALAVDFKAGAASGGISFGTAGTDAVSVTGTAIKDLDTTSFTGTFANAIRSLTGNLTIGSGTTVAAGGAITTFGATSGTQLITTNGKTLDFPVTFNGLGGTFTLQGAVTLGSTRDLTLTNGTLVLNGYVFTTGNFNMGASSVSGNINASVAGSAIYITGATGGWRANGTGTLTGVLPIYLTSTTTTGNRDIRNTVYSNATNVNNRTDFYITGGSGAATITFGVSGGTQGSIDFTGFSGTCNLGTLTAGSFSCFIQCYGHFTLSAGMSTGTYGTNGNLLFYGFVGGATTALITTNGKSITRNPFFGLSANLSATIRLVDNFSTDVLATTALSAATLDLNNQTLTTGLFSASGSTARTIAFGTGNITCTSTGNAWNVATAIAFTVTGTGTISMTAATAKTFVGGSFSYSNVTLNQGGAGTLTITGANTFSNITNTNATASQITFPASTTTTVNAFTLSGSSGNLVSIRSSTPGTQFTLSDASGTVSVSFLDIQDSNATGGATWQSFISNGNVNSGNNLGWNFGSVTYDVNIAELINASDSVLLRLTRFGAVLESATVSDSAASQLTANGAISEQAAIFDTPENILIRFGDISEQAVQSDSAASQLTANGAISESATVSDSAASQLTANGAISESATVSDSAASQLTAVGSVSEQATISDTPENILVRSGAVLEQATQSDSAASQLTAVASVLEQATQSDSASSQLTANGAISETATQSDSAVSQLTAVGLVSESATVSDSTDAKITLLVNIIEQTSISDTTSTILVRMGEIIEQSTVSDSAASQITAATLISETAALSDAAQSLMVFFCTILEGRGERTESTFALPTGTAFTGSTYFNNTSAGGGLTVVANGTGTGSGGGFNAGGNYVLFSGVNTRSIRTKALDLTQCNNFSFSIIRGNSSNGGETPDTGENIVVEYSTNGGGSYTTIATILNTAAITTFTTLSYSTPVGAQTSSTIIRWLQATSSQSAFDQYGIRTFTFDGQPTLVMSDAPAARLVRQGLITEQSALTDTPAAILIRQGLITELATMSETSAAILIRQGLLSEQATASEATAASLLRNGLISEQSAISDESAARLVRQGLISEQASISETISSLIIYLTSILEQGQASVALTTQMTMVASILEQAQSADQAIGNLQILVQVTEGATVLDEASIRFLWELIEDNQVPNWQNASTNQTPGWGNVDTATAPNWQNASTNQTPGWGTINTAADGNWTKINTSPE
jgi:hypothetical protein